MNKSLSKKCAAVLSVAAALSLCACKGATPMSDFIRPLPWQGSIISGTGEDATETAAVAAYEKASYTVVAYDMTDNKEEIARGTMTQTIETPASGNTASFAMKFSITFGNNEKAGVDKGCTDEYASSLSFDIRTLQTIKMEKTVALAAREGVTDLSYSINANYFDSQTATATIAALDAKDKKLSVPKNTFDNEMMFQYARATAIGTSTTTRFEMTNIFDSYVKGSAATSTMIATGAENKEVLDIGDWVSSFGIEKAENGDNYPVTCYNVSIAMSIDESGPPYYVSYSEKPFVSNNKSHAKIPVRIVYHQYRGSAMYRQYEYTLSGLTYEK